MVTWPQLLVCWIPEGWDGPFGPAGRGRVEIVYHDRALGIALVLIPDDLDT